MPLITLVLSVVLLAVPQGRASPPPGLRVDRHLVVVSSTLASCAVEDGSSGPRPCSWNFVGHHDGNGHGLAYWVGRHGGVHYVWARSPLGRGWHFVRAPGARTGARSDRSCVARDRHDVHTVRCADGYRSRQPGQRPVERQSRRRSAAT